MEVDDIQTQASKFSTVGNKIEEEDGELIKRAAANGGGGVGDSGGNASLRGWSNSSRIIRVSRASGGKDRHSKVWTSKGLRDRRVRLSVTTAIQFYDLQDRLGLDQPSKAVEWLIKAASESIAELPSLNASFPDTPKQLSDEKRVSEGVEQGFDSAEVELDGDPSHYQQNQTQQQQQQQQLTLSKSACSSTSETSKNSGLSLSRPGIRANRVKARERARERAVKEKGAHHQQQNMNPISQNSTFTELLTSGIGNVSNNNNNSPSSASAHQNPNAEPDTTARLWPVTPMDYFASGLLGSFSSRGVHHHSSAFPGQIQLLNSLQQHHPMPTPPFTLSSENHQEMQHFSFVPNPDQLIPVATTQPGQGVGVDYNLNFTISSSGLAGFNRGTLQSNSPFFPHHLQRFSSIDGSSQPLYIGTPPVENHHHHHHHQIPAGLDGRLQLYYGDGNRNSDHKGKGKN